MTPTHDHAGRRDRLRDLIVSGDHAVDAFLVGDLTNVRYLTGFTGSNGAVLISASGPAGDRICTDGRYQTQVGEQAGDLEAVLEQESARDRF